MKNDPRSSQGNCQQWYKTGMFEHPVGFGPDKCVFYCCYEPEKECSDPPSSRVQLYYCWGGEVCLRFCEVLILLISIDKELYISHSVPISISTA